MSTSDFLVAFLLIFLAGVGVGTFVIGTLIRKITAETIATIKTDYQKIASDAEKAAQKVENALKAARKALP